MDPIIKERSIRILSAAPAVVESQLNELTDRYTTPVWNIAPVGDQVVVTVVLLHEREIRKQQMAAVAMPMPGIRRN